MSIRTTNSKEVQDYVSERVTAANQEVLIVVANTETLEMIVTPLDSDVPTGFTMIGTFYWDAEISDVMFKGVDTIK